MFEHIEIGASGVGKSLAFKLGERGAKIVIADVDRSALETTTAALTSAGIDAKGEFCDVSDLESCTKGLSVAYPARGAYFGVVA